MDADDLNAQIAADLDALLLSDLDSDDENDAEPLPEIRPLAPIDALCAESEQSGGMADGVESSLCELQRILDAGDTARARFAEDIDALKGVIESLPPKLLADADELAGAAHSVSVSSSASEAVARHSMAVEMAEETIELPWWVHERRAHAAAEALREEARERAAQAARAEREEAMQAVQRATDEAVAAATAELKATHMQLQAEMEEQHKLVERERLQHEARAAALAAEREAAEIAEAASEAEQVEREAERLHRERKRKQREEELRQRVAEAEAKERVRQEREENEAKARARMESRKAVLQVERQREAQREARRSATTRVQSAVRGVLARALRSKRAKQKEEAAVAAEVARLAAEELKRRRIQEAAAAERRRQEEEKARREAEERVRREEAELREAARVRREAEAKRVAEEAARREALRRRREADEACEREKEARRRAEEERRRLKAEATRQHSATLMQAYVRGRLTRLRHGPQGRTATALQFAARALLQRRASRLRSRRRAAAVRLQALWRGSGLRQRLRRALDDARFDDDDDFDYAAVDDTWLCSAMEQLDDAWTLRLPTDDITTAARRPASVGADVPPSPPSLQQAPICSAAGARCAMDARSLSPMDMLSPPRSPRATSSGCLSFVAQGASQSSAFGAGGMVYGDANREGALREMADEWGFTDARHAEGLLKRKQRMLHAKRSAERRKQLSDPLKRLEALQRRAGPNQKAARGAGRVCTSSVGSAALVAPKAGGRGGLRRPAPNRFRWMAADDRADSQTLVLDECGGEVQDELAFASVQSGADDPLEHTELRSFSTDSPNLRLSRSLKAPHTSATDLPRPARMNNFVISPPPSASTDFPNAALPVGAALHAARANR
uniref:Uncharacterized protein n=1 Tax=Calcidiscus leptoporus TaxID=127549 RepID=A0A7S0P438_9EUKA